MFVVSNTLSSKQNNNQKNRNKTKNKSNVPTSYVRVIKTPGSPKPQGARLDGSCLPLPEAPNYKNISCKDFP